MPAGTKQQLRADGPLVRARGAGSGGRGEPLSAVPVLPRALPERGRAGGASQAGAPQRHQDARSLYIRVSYL